MEVLLDGGWRVLCDREEGGSEAGGGRTGQGSGEERDTLWMIDPDGAVEDSERHPG